MTAITRESALSTLLLTALAMLAFAANSILCRLALAGNAIDAAGFTCIRLASGALMLGALWAWRNRGVGRPAFDAPSSIALFVYAIGFSFAYLELPAGTGALLLFGAVQLTMIGCAVARGERPGALAGAGIALAFSGLVYLLLPGIAAPPLDSALLMIAAGCAWGVYTLRGKTATQPLQTSAWNFIGTLPLLAVTAGLLHQQMQATPAGVALAVISGAIASALGYVIWYRALPRLTATHAASVQLSVPILAATGGILLLAEPMTWRLAISAAVVLGGIYLSIRCK